MRVQGQCELRGAAQSHGSHGKHVEKQQSAGHQTFGLPAWHSPPSRGIGAYVYLGAGQRAAPSSTFVLLDGSQQTTADLRGKGDPGELLGHELHHLRGRDARHRAPYDKYQAAGFRDLAVAMSYDPPSYVVNFAETRKLPFKVAIDNTGAVARGGDIKITPTTSSSTEKRM